MSVRALLESIHRESASLAGYVSLLLTRDKVSRREVLEVTYRAARLSNLEEKLRVEAKLPPRTE